MRSPTVARVGVVENMLAEKELERVWGVNEKGASRPVEGW
jgi:hypothetical protein